MFRRYVPASNNCLNTYNFVNSTDGNYNAVRKSADVAVLLTGIKNLDVCGVGYMNEVKRGMTLALVAQKCATGQYTFAHEIGHTYGAQHNRETNDTNSADPTAYGYLVRPPANSGFRTILA